MIVSNNRWWHVCNVDLVFHRNSYNSVCIEDTSKQSDVYSYSSAYDNGTGSGTSTTKHELCYQWI